jgi:hypothetical protein
MTFMQEVIDRFQELHAEMAKGVEGLSPKALDWVPGQEMNSITVLVAHSLASEQAMIGGLILGEPPKGPRGAEFQLRGLTAADLKQRLADADQFIQAALPRISIADLEATRIRPRDGKPITVAWALLHALEHTGEHLGHLQLTRQLWDQGKH